jgi:SAM-dependent methyltransferase
MAGGLDAALAAGAAELAPLLPGSGLAIDLGAGFGMHAIPLARAGYDVLAIDTSAALLGVLQRNGTVLGIRAIEADLLDFRQHTEGEASLIVCLGDTLTHLADWSQVERLFRDVAASLRADGRLVLGFRDYTRPVVDEARFIAVRSDADRIHTCFLETLPERMRVHDIVHERDGAVWRMTVGSYLKLRLAPTKVEAALREVGLEPITEPGPRGMVRIIAGRSKGYLFAAGTGPSRHRPARIGPSAAGQTWVPTRLSDPCSIAPASVPATGRSSRTHCSMDQRTPCARRQPVRRSRSAPRALVLP